MSSRAGAAESVCSVKHSASLCELAAVFLISRYLADFAFWFFSDIINTKIRRHILGVDESHGERKRE